ncbi:MAG: toxic anion resistance protein [Christensenellales bacterium]|jgi:uncharacterized protein YaaN involved in tellurite resistance
MSVSSTFDPVQIARDFETQAQLTLEQRQEVLIQARNIDLQDALTATGYGAKEQRSFGDLSDLLLKRASGDALGDAVAAIHALQEQIESLNIEALRKPKGLLASLLSKEKRQYAALRRDYTEITYLIDRLANNLDMARLALQKEWGMLDTLYERNRACYHALAQKILAGEQALADAMREEPAQDGTNSTQFVDLFSGRLHQLRQSKTISLQLALQIRLTQHNQQLVIDKLKQMTEFALPLWQSQLALALNMNRQQEALGAYRRAARQAVEAMDQAQYALKEGGRDAMQEGDNVLTELERLKKADVQLKQLLEETLVSAQQAKNS